MSHELIWLTIVGMAVVTFVPRVLPLVAVDAEALPYWARRGLTYVPIAVLSAIVAPAFIPSEEFMQFTIDIRLVAGIAAIAVAWRTHSVILTIAVGIGILLAGQ